MVSMYLKMCCHIAPTSITMMMSNDTHITVPIPAIYIKYVITESYCYYGNCKGSIKTVTRTKCCVVKPESNDAPSPKKNAERQGSYVDDTDL